MANDLQHDVAIVGASIAGCTAAILFARNGARVALIEREGDPAAYKKICTHFIQPGATPSGLVSRTQSKQQAESASRGLRDGVGLSLHQDVIRRGLPMATIFGVRRSTP
jgi:2-polyprenyl-6-methoxyphenol hydroxylase-like FAD-dependent oxidoreductase